MAVRGPTTGAVLVTGGAGFIGSHLVDALIETGHNVRVLDRLVTQVHGEDRPRHLHPDAELIVGTVEDREVVERALDGVEVVYHEAAEVGVGQSMYEMVRYASANTVGTTVLLEALASRRDSIRKLVVASSMSIYGEGAYECPACGPTLQASLRPAAQLRDRRWEPECGACGRPLRTLPTPETKTLEPSSVYAVTKQDQEQLCLIAGRAYEIPTVALRYFNVYGPRQALSNPYTGVCAIFSARLLNDQAPLIFEDGNQTRDFIHVSDIVRANLLALATDRADGMAVNIGTGVPTSVASVAELLADALGRSQTAEVVGRFREGDIRHCVADVSRALQLLDFEPTVGLADGLPELAEWVSGEVAADRVLEATSELEAHRLVH
jgi:dTDP-L-rhamnose 4-epimerase